MQLSANKDIQRVADRVISLGLAKGDKTKANHGRLIPTDRSKPILVFPSTPSDHRSVLNFFADVKRTWGPEWDRDPDKEYVPIIDETKYAENTVVDPAETMALDDLEAQLQKLQGIRNKRVAEARVQIEAELGRAEADWRSAQEDVRAAEALCAEARLRVYRLKERLGHRDPVERKITRNLPDNILELYNKTKSSCIATRGRNPGEFSCRSFAAMHKLDYNSVLAWYAANRNTLS